MSTATERYELVAGYESASLPARYEAARKHLAECERIDECKEWKDKAEALRSYARQAHDDELYRMATKIQNRARVRMGELIRQAEKSKGGRKKTTGDAPSSSRRSFAQQAGLSPDQEHEAKAMSRVPAAKREEMIERGATATEIAEEGRNYDDAGRRRERFARCIHCKGRVPAGESHRCLPEGFEKATRLLGDLGRLRAFMADNAPTTMAGACREGERAQILADAKAVSEWLARLIGALSKKRKTK